jgi:hypothetical protein
VQGTFAAIRTTAGAATSNIDNTAGIRSENLKLDGTRTFTFKDVVVTIPAYDVTVAGTPEHAGFGYVGRTIDLRAAKIHLYKQVGTSYQELPGSPVNAPASWGTRRSYGQLVALRTDEANPTWHVEDLSLSLPSLEADLNGLADKAVLSLATPAPVFSTTCNDPNGACSATAWSTPDPMPFYLSDGDAAKLAADWRRAQDSFVAAGAASTDLNYSALGLVYALEYDPLVAVGWQVLTAVSTSDQLIWEQLEYQQGYPLYLPRTYATDCARLACNSRQATLDSGQSFRVSASSGGRSCQTFDEEDRESVKRCTQYAQMYSIHQYRGGTSHFWGGSMMATLGWHEGDNDHLNLGLKMTKLPVFDASSTSSEALYAEWTYYPDNPQNPDGGGTCQNEPYSGGPATQNIHRPAAWARDVNDYWFGWRLQEFGSSDDRAGVRQANWNDEYVDAFYCGVDHAPANRISFALMHTYGWVQDGRNNEAGRFALAYGHNKTQTRWKFGCGPGFDFVPKPGVGVGCGWEPQSEDTRVWTIASVQEFRY